MSLLPLGVARRAVKQYLRRRGLMVVERRHLCDWQLGEPVPLADRQSPDGASDYLVEDNPRLLELKARYKCFGTDAGEAFVWSDGYLSKDNLLYFRDDNPYVFQLRGQNMNPLSYGLTYFALRARPDVRRILDAVSEDRLFGVRSFEIEGRAVTRDLLDSATELTFLQRRLGTSIDGSIVLDIGAGYGRLAHRAVVAWPSMRSYICTDAIAESSFICEYYLSFRGVAGKAVVVPLDEIESHISRFRPTVAVNIHSFSECSLPAINWWCQLLARYRIPRLMIVPNRTAGDSITPLTNDGHDFSEVLRHNGYHLLGAEPKYQEPIVQKYGINPTTHLWYALRGCAE